MFGKTPAGTEAARPTRSTPRGGLCKPRTDLFTDKPKRRLEVLFAADQQMQVQATSGIYQRLIAAYREPDRNQARHLMTKLIDALSHGVPVALTELITLGRTLKKPAADVLACFDRPGPSNGPTEAIEGDRRTPRTAPRLHRRLPQPHRLHRPITTRNRGLQATTTP